MNAQPLVYRCPHCRTAVEVQSQASEQMVVCPVCNKPFEAELPTARPEGTAAVNGQPTGNGTPATNGAAVAAVAPAPAPAPLAPPMEPTLPPEEMLEIIRVSMWRRYPFRCLAYMMVIIASSVGSIVALSQDMNIVAAIAAIVLLAALIRFVPWWLRMRNTTLTITNRRCIIETGILHRTGTEFERGELIGVHVAQGGVLRVFDVGDLIISSGNNTRKQFVLMAVPDPTTVAAHLRDLNVTPQHQAPAPQPQQVQQPQPV